MNDHITSSLLDRYGIKHGFGTIQSPLCNVNLEELPQWKQVHGAQYCMVKSAKDNCHEADALMTQSPNQWIGVKTADCVPILLSKKDGSWVAAVHSGWKGTEQRIIKKVIFSLKSSGEKMNDWLAVIGPCISWQAYEVSSELIDKFKALLGQENQKYFEPKKRHLNLRWIIEHEIRSSGLQTLESLEYCTFLSETRVSEYRFYSYRRDRSKGRQYSLIKASEN